MGDHVAFPCALGLITGVEEIWAGGDGCVIEVAFQASSSMRVGDRWMTLDDSEGGQVGG